MKTKTTGLVIFHGGKVASGRLMLSAVALLTFGITATAQNTSYNLNSIPLPTGTNNATFGGGSMLLNTASYNTATGWLVLSNNTSGAINSATGYGALNGNTTGSSNSGFGSKAFSSNTTGSNNTGAGAQAMLNNTTGSNNSALGFNTNITAPNFNNSTAVGANALVNGPNRVWLGNAGTTVWTNISYNLSDGRFKKNIKSESVKGLAFIKLLRPVTYNFDGNMFNDYITKNMPADQRKNYINQDFSQVDNITQTGFIAQEVEQAAKTAGYNFSGVHAPEGETDTYGISYYQFVVPLVKAVQEQQEMIEAQKAINENLQQQILELKKLVAEKPSTSTGLNQQNGINRFSMEQNEPNPFTHETIVKYNLPETVNNAYMAVYDLSGKQLATFPITQKGSSSITVTSEKLSAGIYMYSIVADGKIFDSKKMIVANK